MTIHVGSVAKEADPGVARRVAETRRRKPAAAAGPSDDARTQITIAVPELRPWRARFDFLQYEHEVVPWGFALERAVTIEEAEAAPEGDRLSASVVRRFTEDVFLYQRVAEFKLRHQHGKAETLHRRLGHRDLGLVAEFWRALSDSPTRSYDMAEIFGVNRSTIHRWKDRAVEAGHLDESELNRRR
jgi:hypothetical protein